MKCVFLCWSNCHIFNFFFLRVSGKITVYAETRSTSQCQVHSFQRWRQGGRHTERGDGTEKERSRTVRLFPNKCWEAADSLSQWNLQCSGCAERRTEQRGHGRSSERRKRLIVSKNTWICLHFPSLTKGHLKVPWPLVCCLIKPMQ